MLLSDWLHGVRRQLFPHWASRPARRMRSRLRRRGGAGHVLVASCVELLEPRMLLAAGSQSAPLAVTQLAVADYTSSNQQALVHIVQTGPGDVLFVDRLGNMVPGGFSSATQANAPGYGNETATYNAGIVNWSDGTVWTPTSPNLGTLKITDYIT